MYSEEYAQQLRQMHVQKEHFGKGGCDWGAKVMAMCMEFQTTEVLDYGCGKGTLNLHLPFPVACYDPGILKYCGKPEPADIVVCTDVLEHIEPEHLEDVLNDLRRVTKRMLLLHVHCGPAKKTLPDGRNAHLIQQPPLWWMDKLSNLFELDVLEYPGERERDLLFTATGIPCGSS